MVLKNSKRNLVLFLLIISYAALHAQNNRLQSLVSSNDIVYYSHPSNDNDGMPVGNGQFGGLLVGNENSLTWQMNHTGFWRFDPQLKHSEYGARPFGLGRITISWQQTPPLARKEIKQRLSLYDAVFSMNNSSDVSVENFFDMQEDYGVFKFKTHSKKPIVIKVDLEGWRNSNSFFDIESGVGIMDSADVARSPEEIAYLQKLTSNTYRLLKNSQATGIKVIGSPVIKISGEKMKRTLQFELKSGKEVMLYVATSVLEEEANLKSPVSSAIKLLEQAIKTTYLTLKRKHDTWWENYWQASNIHIESNDSLASYAENLWYLHLYQMAIANRGKYPIKFNQGNWIVNNDERQWGGGYWHFNQQYTHMSMLAANHFEFLDNYYEPLYKNLELLKATSLELWKHPGAFLHETHSPDGVAYKGNRQRIYSDTTMWTGLIFSTGCEVAFQMYQYALYLDDDRYMREKVYPFMREVCLFYQYHLKKDERGMYYIYPSNVHENFWRVKNSITDLAAIRACFPLLIKMYDQFGGDLSERQKFQEMLDHLSPYPKGEWQVRGKRDMGGVISGVDASIDMFAPAILGTDSVIHNRHGIDLYTVYPFELTLPRKPGYQTAVNTFNNRFFKEIKWVLQHDMLPAALLQLSGEARNTIADYIAICPTTANGIFKESDIHCVTLGLNFMLLQSHDGVIELFPACPQNWNVSFKLRAEGSLLVEARKEKEKLLVCSIQSLKTRKISIKNNWNSGVDIYDEDKLIFSSIEKIVSWQGTKSKTYTLVEKGHKPAKTFLSTPRKKNDTIKNFRGKQLGI